MRITSIVFIGLGLTFFSLRGACQFSSAITPEEKAEAQAQHSFHPKLVMQDALSKAEKFMVSEQIDAGHFWLYRAQYIMLWRHNHSGQRQTSGLAFLVGQ